jgi:hypothetical protein
MISDVCTQKQKKTCRILESSHLKANIIMNFKSTISYELDLAGSESVVKFQIL